MAIINFEKAKAKMYLKGKVTGYLADIDEGVLELQRQYREYAQYCNRWYDEQVVGKDKDWGMDI